MSIIYTIFTVAAQSQVRSSTMLLLCIAENSEVRVLIGSNGIMFFHHNPFSGSRVEAFERTDSHDQRSLYAHRARNT
jgi:hypothetical protein